MGKIRKPLTDEQKARRDAYQKQWRASHKQYILDYAKNYRKTHKDEGDAYHYEYRRTLKGAFNYNKYYAKRRGREWTIPFELFAELKQKPCFYCGGKVEECGSSLDRKDNSKGYLPDNVVTCCDRCNSAKSDFFTFEEFKYIMDQRRLKNGV